MAEDHIFERLEILRDGTIVLHCRECFPLTIAPNAGPLTLMSEDGRLTYLRESPEGLYALDNVTSGDK